MNRTELFKRAKKHGHQPGKKMPERGKANLKKELIDYFKTPEGQRAFGLAPSWLLKKSPEEVAELLLSEVEDIGQNQAATTN